VTCEHKRWIKTSKFPYHPTHSSRTIFLRAFLWTLEISKGELLCSDHVSKVSTKTFITFYKKLHIYLRLTGSQCFQFTFGHSLVNPTRQAGKLRVLIVPRGAFNNPVCDRLIWWVTTLTYGYERNYKIIIIIKIYTCQLRFC
jgi:hypothetical protein